MSNSVNSLNIKSAGIPVFDGVATFTESTTTQYNILVGGTSNSIANVAPSATTGVPLVSGGSAANPSFGTASVAGGGTGAVTLTGVLIGNGTSAITGNAVTQYNVLVGGASNAVTSVAPSTAGVPLVSTGPSANPGFGTAVVAGGGTGITSATTYAPLCGGTTSTGALQSASTGISNSGYVLTSTGSSSLPTWQATSAGSGSLILIQTQTASGSISAINFTSGVTGYSTYFITFSNVKTINGNLGLRLSNNGGSTWITSSYNSECQYIEYGVTTWSQLGSSSSFILMPGGSGVTTQYANGNTWIYNVGTLLSPWVVFDGVGLSAATNRVIASGNYVAGVTPNAFQIFVDSGLISGGSFSLYGLVQ